MALSIPCGRPSDPSRIRFFTSAAVEVDGYGDLAYAKGTDSLSILADADTVTVQGKWVQIFRKQVDGSWLIALDIWNSDDPLTSAER